MKTFASHSIMTGAAMAALTICLCAGARASDKAVAKTNEPPVPRSVFVNNAESGKDPFFPNSSRRVQVARVSVTNTVSQTSGLLDQLVLKGISGTKAQPLAIINSSTVTKGEVADIKCGLKYVKVRCVAIHDGSVLVELFGTSETRELRLREGI